MSARNIYEQDLDQVAANHVPLSPLSFIERAASVYPNRLSVIHNEQRYTWTETFARCRRLCSALKKRGFGLGDTVAIVATNIPAFYESLFGVPAAGAVLNPINIRLDADAIALEAPGMVASPDEMELVTAVLTMPAW
jgi:fatty-acyl-CoA synthase